MHPTYLSYLQSRSTTSAQRQLPASAHGA
jgi:hypothetical protein